MDEQGYIPDDNGFFAARHDVHRDGFDADSGGELRKLDERVTENGTEWLVRDKHHTDEQAVWVPASVFD